MDHFRIKSGEQLLIIQKYLEEVAEEFPKIKLNEEKIASLLAVLAPVFQGMDNIQWMHLPAVEAKEELYTQDEEVIRIFMKSPVAFAVITLERGLCIVEISQDLASTLIRWNYITQKRPFEWDKTKFETETYYEVGGILGSHFVFKADQNPHEKVQFFNELFFHFSRSSRQWIDGLKSTRPKSHLEL